MRWLTTISSLSIDWEQAWSCTPCPRGTYGGSSNLTDVSQCVLCPAGTYNDKLGRQTIDDCSICPPSTWVPLNTPDIIASSQLTFPHYPYRYGATKGLTTSKCTGPCPSHTYSRVGGLTDYKQCLTCQAGDQVRREAGRKVAKEPEYGLIWSPNGSLCTSSLPPVLFFLGLFSVAWMWLAADSTQRPISFSDIAIKFRKNTLGKEERLWVS